ncbi:MAG: hypothetical protein AB7O88_16645 [Reyranellaceae bacterium]
MVDESAPTVEELAGWYTLQQARDRAALRYPAEDPATVVWNRLRAGMIRIAAISHSIQKGYGRPEPQRSPILMPGYVWGLLDKAPPELWRDEVFFQVPGDEQDRGDRIYVTAFNLRLDPTDVDRELPLPAAAPAKAQISASGRPRAAFWDDLLIATFKRIYFGDFKPTQQTDIEKTMLDWAASVGVEVDPSTVRIRAAKLWKALKDEG